MIRTVEYTSAKKLEEKVAGYFRAISTTVEVRQNNEPVISDAGRPVTRLEYHLPPTVTGLCRWLGILPQTWRDYCDEGLHPAFKTATRWAAMMMEDYLVTELLLRSKGPEGVKQLLKDYEPQQEEAPAAPGQEAQLDLTGKRDLLRQLLAGDGDA